MEEDQRRAFSFDVMETAFSIGLAIIAAPVAIQVGLFWQPLSPEARELCGSSQGSAAERNLIIVIASNLASFHALPWAAPGPPPAPLEQAQGRGG
jgi:hypothetical protein